MSRTWTSRNTAVPDWLLGTRRMVDSPMGPDTISAGSQPDLEHGGDGDLAKDIRPLEVAHTRPARGAEASIVPSAVSSEHTSHIGEGSVPEGSADSQPPENQLRRRFTSADHVHKKPLTEPEEQVCLK